MMLLEQKKGKKKNSVNPTSPSNNNTLRTRTVEASLCQNKSQYLIRKLLIMMNQLNLYTMIGLLLYQKIVAYIPDVKDFTALYFL